MDCLHPYCPAGHGAPSWKDLVSLSSFRLDAGRKELLLQMLEAHCSVGPNSGAIAQPLPAIGGPALKALLNFCPCLFCQLNVKCTPRGVVHLCELTLGARITSDNVHAAFLIQHPKKGHSFKFTPIEKCTDGGTVMEMLCSEVLASAGIPAMPVGKDGWPQWQMPGHILLNEGKMGALRAFGDILIPCGPTNLVISVKSEAARERLLYSSNSIEGVGFGFFNEPEEFWSESRMNLYKRMGFSAIYLPSDTHAQIMTKLKKAGIEKKSVNVNGTELYRPLESFANDMMSVVGKHSLLL